MPANTLKKLMTCTKSERLGANRVGSSEMQNSWITIKKQKIYNFYGILEKIAWIWRIFGIFPFTIKGPMAMLKYGLNKYWSVYSIFLCCGCIANVICSVLQYHSHIGRDVSVAPVTICTRTFASILCLSASSILRIIRHKDLTESMVTMTEQKIILEKLGCSLTYDRSARIIVTYVWTTMITVSSLMMYDYYAAIRSYGSVNIERWILWNIPFMGQFIDGTIFVSLVALLGLQFRAINDKLKAIAARTNSFTPKVIMNSDDCAENLRLMTKVHYNICTAGKRINSIFVWNIVINVVTAFIIFSTTFYYIFVEVERRETADYFRIGTYLHWEFIHSVPIIVMVAICHWTSQQANYAGKLIHEIRVSKIDYQLYEAMKTFSLQLHHQKLEFSAGGFFPVNPTLLQTMIGNITTYLVLLLQFQPKWD